MRKKVYPNEIPYKLQSQCAKCMVQNRNRKWIKQPPSISVTLRINYADTIIFEPVHNQWAHTGYAKFRGLSAELSLNRKTASSLQTYCPRQHSAGRISSGCCSIPTKFTLSHTFPQHSPTKSCFFPGGSVSSARVCKEFQPSALVPKHSTRGSRRRWPTIMIASYIGSGHHPHGGIVIAVCCSSKCHSVYSDGDGLCLWWHSPECVRPACLCLPSTDVVAVT